MICAKRKRPLPPPLLPHPNRDARCSPKWWFRNETQHSKFAESKGLCVNQMPQVNFFTIGWVSCDQSSQFSADYH